jgi:two-component system cell cycle sensor histidine kinase/response regulator CckA
MEDPAHQDVAEIKKAGERAALLTRQLLAFSRRQVLQPKSLDLNRVVENLGKMLHRLLGEDIELSIVPDPSLWLVMADPGQLGQVILNLAVNARDAMPRGGRLVLKTANVKLDEAYAAVHDQVQPGPHVLLSVSDTGCGMDAVTRSRIFEPFFTTKELGKGTGLGLSTVYGIIRQSGGHIWVYSEPGQGTTFKIYLPRFAAGAAVLQEEPAPAPYLKGQETILLVEDETLVRQIARRILESHGYSVLEAKDGQEALRLQEEHPSPIHLMLTDLVMPGFGGQELASRLAARCPSLKVLFMSGYAESGILDKELASRGDVYLQKPFEAHALVRKVRELLDAPGSPPPSPDPLSQPLPG